MNWVQRHTACDRLSKIEIPGQNFVPDRFGNPLTAQVGFDSEDRVQYDPRPFDRLLKSCNPASRLANIDLKPITSERALGEYVTRYTKALEKPFDVFMAPEASTNSTCQEKLDEMLGEWVYSAQETTHLLKGIPMVCCSVSFRTLNLGSDGGCRKPRLQEPNKGDEGVDAQEKNPLVNDNSWLQRYMRRPLEMEELSIYDVMNKYT